MPTSPAPLGARWRFSPALAEFEAYLEQGRPRHVNEPANLCGHTHTAGADSCATTGETDFYETPRGFWEFCDAGHRVMCRATPLLVTCLRSGGDVGSGVYTVQPKSEPPPKKMRTEIATYQNRR